jgi:hypothetical protein
MIIMEQSQPQCFSAMLSFAIGHSQTAARFYLPCCWETLAVMAARDHCCDVRPTIPSGEPPPGAPAAAGTFQCGRSFRCVIGVMGAASTVGYEVERSERSAGPDLCPTIRKRAPTL